jgi:hypothetical protein
LGFRDGQEGIVLQNFTGKYVRLQLPPRFERVVDDFEMIRLLDEGYVLISNLTGTDIPRGYRPVSGYPTYFSEETLLVIRYNESIGFAHWGNPIQIGASYWGETEPKWSIIVHEMAHNFQTSRSYMKLLLEPDERIGDLVEGFASLASMYVLSQMAESPTKDQANATITNQILSHYVIERRNFLTSFERWRIGGGGLDTLDGNSSTGLLLTIAEQHGWTAFETFFQIFRNIDKTEGEILLSADSEVRRATFLAAALSLSSGADIGSMFTSFKISIDRGYYDSLLVELQGYV